VLHPFFSFLFPLDLVASFPNWGHTLKSDFPKRFFFAILNLSASGRCPGHHVLHLFASFPNWGHTLESEFSTNRYGRLEFQKQCIDVLLQKHP